MKVQDVFNDYVIPRTQEVFKSRLVLSDERGYIIKTSDGRWLDFVGSIDFIINFQQTKGQDFINALSEQAESFRYPFVFIDSEQVVYGKEGNVRIGRMVIGTSTMEAYHAGTRDLFVYSPILDPIFECLNDAVVSNFNVESGFELPKVYRYKGQDDGMPEWVDAIVCENFNLQLINKNCYA